MQKKYLYSLGFLLMSALFVVSLQMDIGKNNMMASDGINYKANVCVSHISEGKLISEQCSHNILTNDGKDLIKNYLSKGGLGTVDFIGLCNATSGCNVSSATSTYLNSEYTSGGMNRAQGTYLSLGTGNWSIYKQFTATSDNLLINKTGLFNATSAGTLFAENTFTLVTLQTNDQLTINWTISVT